MNLPAYSSPFLVPQGASDVEITYVQQPGGPPPRGITKWVADKIEEQNRPILQVTWRRGGVPGVALVELDVLSDRGLPTDYQSLSQSFPQIKWSQS